MGRTLAHYVNFAAGRIALPMELPFDFRDVKRLSISACGTAYLAGLVGKYWFERLARLPRRDRRRFRVPLSRSAHGVGQRSPLRLAIGRDRRHLASLRYAKSNGQHILTVVNVSTSTMARESTVVAQTLAGMEVGVASTRRSPASSRSF